MEIILSNHATCKRPRCLYWHYWQVSIESIVVPSSYVYTAETLLSYYLWVALFRYFYPKKTGQTILTLIMEGVNFLVTTRKLRPINFLVTFKSLWQHNKKRLNLSPKLWMSRNTDREPLLINFPQIKQLRLANIFDKMQICTIQLGYEMVTIGIFYTHPYLFTSLSFGL